MTFSRTPHNQSNLGLLPMSAHAVFASKKLEVCLLIGLASATADAQVASSESPISMMQAAIGLALIAAMGLFVVLRRRHQEAQDRHKEQVFEKHQRREGLRSDFEADLADVVSRSNADDLSFVVLRRLLAHTKRLVPNRGAAAIVSFSGGEERLVAPDPRSQAEFEHIVKAHERALKNVSWSGANVVLDLRTEVGRWPQQKLAALPIPIPKPGYGMLMISREINQGFGDDELDDAADFAQIAIDSMQLAKHEARDKQDREIDRLTGVYNRQAVELRSSTMFTEAVKSRTNFSMVWLELDQFRVFIKDHGQEKADSVLKTTAQRIQRALEKLQLVGRWDHQEFVILMPTVPEFQAQKLAENLVKLVSREINLNPADPSMQVTASVGFASKYPSDTHFTKLLERAAKGKDQAKFAGGNGARRGSDEVGGVNFQKF